jgi:two-component system, NarL family, response regulator NreC
MPSTPLTRVMIVDDLAIVRECIRALLQRQSGISVVGLVASGEQAIVEARRLRPDLIVMDLVLPGLSGADATLLILGTLPRARVIVLSSSCEVEHVRVALRAGAHGYIVKEAVGSELTSAVVAVMAGGQYLSPQIAASLQHGELNGGVSGLWQRLTPREREVLRRTAAGVSTSQIALQLSLSPKTVDSYRSRSMRKLGLANRSTLIRFAMRHSASVE